jgi:hypothetical protein
MAQNLEPNDDDVSDAEMDRMMAPFMSILFDTVMEDPQFGQRMDIMYEGGLKPKDISVLTDFQKNADAVGAFLEERLENCSEDCVEDWGDEPDLFAADVGELTSVNIPLVLEKGVHVERSGDNSSPGFVLIHKDKDVLARVIEELGLKAGPIRSDGGNKVVEFIMLRLSASDELEAVRRGFRVGHEPMGIKLDPAG